MKRLLSVLSIQERNANLSKVMAYRTLTSDLLVPIYTPVWGKTMLWSKVSFLRKAHVAEINLEPLKFRASVLIKLCSCFHILFGDLVMLKVAI